MRVTSSTHFPRIPPTRDFEPLTSTRLVHRGNHQPYEPDLTGGSTNNIPGAGTPYQTRGASRDCPPQSVPTEAPGRPKRGTEHPHTDHRQSRRAPPPVPNKSTPPGDTLTPNNADARHPKRGHTSTHQPTVPDTRDTQQQARGPTKSTSQTKRDPGTENSHTDRGPQTAPFLDFRMFAPGSKTTTRKSP